MMGNGQVGGDGSVKWLFQGDNIKGTPRSDPRGVKGIEQEGVDDTNDGDQFTVTVTLPQDSSALLSLLGQLRNWVTNPLGPIVFNLPIEKNVEDQISIR
jgi:hypothetical protein